MQKQADLKSLVNGESGLVSRLIFVDQEIYEQELEKIFAKSWLYLGHETELKQQGDYLTTYMGEDPVMVTRDSSGKLHAFLNSCRHRGMRICRSEAGNSNFFRCPYHGWTYRNDGKLIGVPKFENAYYGELNKDAWGLYEVPNVYSYKGMIWGNWDPKAPSLMDYLGGMRYYLDLMIDRSPQGVEIFGGVQKWEIDTNWKIAADNFVGDHYHVMVTHASTVELGLRKPFGDEGYQIAAGNGHGLGGDSGGIGKGTVVKTAYTPFIEAMRSRLLSDKGSVTEKIVPIGHGTIFPNFSFLDTLRYRNFRVWHPRGPFALEVYSWTIVDRDLPQDLKMQVRQQNLITNGPAGFFEVEDPENWSQCTASTRGWVGRHLEFNYQMGMKHERPAKDILEADVPGNAGRIWSEINQRAFYNRWLELMEAGDHGSLPPSKSAESSAPPGEDGRGSSTSRRQSRTTRTSHGRKAARTD